jgi:hypothetical protein
VVVVFLPHHQTLHLSHPGVSLKKVLKRRKTLIVSLKEKGTCLFYITLKSWLDIVPEILHNLPKHHKKFLPKFDP